MKIYESIIKRVDKLSLNQYAKLKHDIENRESQKSGLEAFRNSVNRYISFTKFWIYTVAILVILGMVYLLNIVIFSTFKTEIEPLLLSVATVIGVLIIGFLFYENRVIKVLLKKIGLILFFPIRLLDTIIFKIYWKPLFKSHITQDNKEYIQHFLWFDCLDYMERLERVKGVLVDDSIPK